MSEERPHCVVCKVGQMRPGETTFTFDNGAGYTVVVRHVPAEVCDNCGDAQVSDEVAEELMRRAKMPSPGTGVLILDYAA
jgi:YgiT-type zinc finger domain-containing protein